jgi:hypothetical protein
MTTDPPFFVVLDDRGVLRVDGEDRVSFLQGLVSNDVARVAADRAVYAALLTAQGRFLHDFFIVAGPAGFLLDCERERTRDLARRLGLYRLRSRVRLTEAGDDWTVAAVMGDGVEGLCGLPSLAGAAAPFAGGIACVDPRAAAAGVRLVLPRPTAAASLAALGLAAADRTRYEARRIALGLPDGSRDMEPEEALLLEFGLDACGAIDWDKGCWLGQEVTARMRYRGLVKKRLVPVAVDGALPPPGSAVLQGDREVGEIRTGVPGLALALLRIEALNAGRPLAAAGAGLRPVAPSSPASSGSAA